jgi:hypothetical protein
MNWQTIFNPFSKFSENNYVFGFLFFLSIHLFAFHTNKNGYTPKKTYRYHLRYFSQV